MTENAGAAGAMPQPDPMQFSLGLILAFWEQRAIWAAAHLKLADAVGDAPQTVAALAAATGTQPQQLARLLNVLVRAGIFARMPDGRIAPTPLSACLRSDHPQSQRVVIDAILGGEHFAAWEALEEALRTGGTAFDIRFGMSWVDYYRKDREAGERFAAALSTSGRAFEEAVTSCHSFDPFEVAIDVGGSHGSLLRALLARHPQARGIVFDLPDTAASATAQWAGSPDAGRLQAVGGDFFKQVPSGDLYLLKFILHDWDDERAVAILRTIRTAISVHGRIAIVETVMPDEDSQHPASLMDLNMLVMTGGRERTLPQYRALLKQAGFRVHRVTPTPAMLSVVEAVPV
jgi:hypothetical protein